MGLIKGLGWITAGAAVATIAFAQYRSSETGRDIVTVLQNLPQELKEAQAEWQQKAMDAMEEGKRAAAEREAEIDRELDVHETHEQEVPDFIV